MRTAAGPKGPAAVLEKDCVNDRKQGRGVQRVVRGVHFALGGCKRKRQYYVNWNWASKIVQLGSTKEISIVDVFDWLS